MSFTITALANTIKLTIDGTFVGAYDSMDEVDTVIDAYRGRI
jgi:hypothetical protein